MKPTNPLGRPWILLVALVAPVTLMAACADTRDSEPANTVENAEKTMFADSEAYEQFMGRWSRRLAPAFLEFVGLADGHAVLDVGSGTGALARAVLDRTTTSRVVGVDLSPGYVSYARSRVQDARVTFEEGDAQRLQFADASFDRTVSLLVVNFIPDAGMAVREMARVTRPGGIAAAAVWDYGEGMEMLRVFWDEAIALDPASDARDERHMPFCRPGELARLWRDHGLVDVREVPLVITLDFPSFDDFWQPFLGRQGPAGAYVAALPEARRLELERRLRERLSGPVGDGPIQLTARAWAVQGVVPPR